MGLTAALKLREGISRKKNTKMKLLLLAVFVAVAFASEAEEPAAKVSEPVAEAEAPKEHAAVGPVHAVRPFYGWYGHQLQWPGFRAPGFSSQCFGCRPHHFGKRSADAEPGWTGYGYALPGNSYAKVNRHFGKRSAEADTEPGYYGYYGYPYGYYGYPYGYRYHAYGPGIAGHPSGTSYVHTSGAAG